MGKNKLDRPLVEQTENYGLFERMVYYQAQEQGGCWSNLSEALEPGKITNGIEKFLENFVTSIEDGEDEK